MYVASCFSIPIPVAAASWAICWVAPPTNLRQGIKLAPTCYPASLSLNASSTHQPPYSYNLHRHDARTEPANQQLPVRYQKKRCRHISR